MVAVYLGHLASQTLVQSYFWRILIGTIIRLAASFLGEAVIMSTWTCFAVGFQLFTLSSAQLVWNCGRLATVYQALKESALQIDLTTRRQTAVSVVTRQEASCIALLFMCHSSTVERCHFLMKPNFGDLLLRRFVKKPNFGDLLIRRFVESPTSETCSLGGSSKSPTSETCS